MAIEKEQLVEILNGEGEVDAKATKLMEVFDADTKYQLNSVLINKQKILDEKTELEGKFKSMKTENENLNNKMKTLEEQLSKNSPDEIKKIYETQLSEATSVHEKKIQELTNKISGYQTKVKELEKVHLQMDCMEKFNKAIAGKNISSDAISDFADYVLGKDCCKFDYRPIGDGKNVIATVEGIQIEGAVNSALETSFGKRCVTVNSSGGNAEGAKSFSGGGKSIPRVQFDNLTPDEKMKLMQEGFKIV